MKTRRPPSPLVRSLLEAVPPASGAVVMATGIVSLAMGLVGRMLLSRVLLGVAAAVWLALGALLAARLRHEHRRLRLEASSPGALTAVAATAVLGAGVAALGWTGPAVAALVGAAALWLLLLPPVLRAWSTPTTGVSFMLVVSTEALAVLAATVAQPLDAPWPAAAAVVPLLLGVAAYVAVLARFDREQLRVGRGDEWVAGGALAISTLAAARLTRAAAVLGADAWARAALCDATLALAAAAALWLPVLVACELRWPRPRYDLRRWATVFPVGMYAVAGAATGDVTDHPALVRAGHLLAWATLAVWVVVAAGLLRRVGPVLRRGGRRA